MNLKPPQEYKSGQRKPSFSGLWKWTEAVETAPPPPLPPEPEESFEEVLPPVEEEEDYEQIIEGEEETLEHGDSNTKDDILNLDELRPLGKSPLVFGKGSLWKLTSESSEEPTPLEEKPIYQAEAAVSDEETAEEEPAEEPEFEDEYDYDVSGKRPAKVKRSWGYGFVVVILMTAFGSVTLAVWLMLLKTKVSIPNILVNTSIIALLLFLLLVVGRYLFLIFFSFFQHSRNKAMSTELEPPFLKASILVPAYNEEVVIERSIRSLVELDYPNYEIIVINDGSKDRTLELARNLEGFHGHVQVRVLDQENGGKSSALNHGAREATGDILICVDGDSRLHPYTLHMAMRHFKDPTLTALAGNVKVVNRINTITKLQALEYIEGLNLVRRAQAFFRVVNIVPGPIGLFRREAILEVGGWDHDTFAEDCDLTLKLLARGYRIDYEPEAISYTEAPETLLPLLKQRYRWTRGILQALRKHRRLLVDPLRGWQITVTM